MDEMDLKFNSFKIFFRAQIIDARLKIWGGGQESYIFLLKSREGGGGLAFWTKSEGSGVHN
jgi:hypothetical protein